MKKRINIGILVTVLSAMMLLTGCSTSKEKMFPHSDSTMMDIYNQKATGGATTLFDKRLELRRGSDDLTQSMDIVTHTRVAQTEVSNLFQRLPNPDLVMYIYPHLASEGKLPVPGYSTVFSFYGEVQYAMPGEYVERNER